MAKIRTSEGTAPRRRAPASKAETVALVAAAQAGDRRAFATLYRAHGRMVHGVLLARLPRTELGDAMQEVFTAALAKLASLREPGSFSPWLAAIARNVARDWHKRGRKLHELSEAPEQLDTRSRDAGPREGVVDRLALLDALAELSEDYRELLTLRFAEGLTGPEIAAALGMTPGSVRVKLHRGVQALREQLADPKQPGGGS